MTYDKILPEVIAYLKELRCNLKENEGKIKEKAATSLQYLKND